MKKGWKTLFLTGVTLVLASVGPLMFPSAETGFSRLSTLALYGLLPSIVLLAAIAFAVRHSQPLITRSIAWGALAGGIATGGLEAVRIPGFHLGYMPGSLPQLMGVLTLHQFMTGPTVLSNLAGWGYHVWNGAAFGIIYVLFVGTRKGWLAVIYAFFIGTIFMVSPVVHSLGIGNFGFKFSVGFSIVVYMAHIAYGSILGWLSKRFLGPQPSTFFWAVRFLLHKVAPGKVAAVVDQLADQ